MYFSYLATKIDSDLTVIRLGSRDHHIVSVELMTMCLCVRCVCTWYVYVYMCVCVYTQYMRIYCGYCSEFYNNKQ